MLNDVHQTNPSIILKTRFVREKSTSVWFTVRRKLPSMSSANGQLTAGRRVVRRCGQARNPIWGHVDFRPFIRAGPRPISS